MKLVTQTEVLSEYLGDEAAVRIICERGFDGLDYSMFKMSEDDDILNTGEYLNHAKKLLDIASSYGKTFEQAHSPFPSCREGNAEYNEKMFDKLKRSLEIAGILDAKICVVHPVQYSSNQKEQNMELYHKLEPYAADYGVKIALENAPTHINPACPEESSPKIPTVKFKETATIEYTHRGTHKPFNKLLIPTVPLSSVIIR